MNLYAYVGNNPLNATDPTGMQSDDGWRDRMRQNEGCDSGCQERADEIADARWSMVQSLAESRAANGNDFVHNQIFQALNESATSYALTGETASFVDVADEFSTIVGPEALMTALGVGTIRGVQGLTHARSMRGIYHARISSIPARATARGGTLEEQARWAFQQRQQIREGVRQGIDGWINAIFRPQPRTFEGMIAQRMSRGMTREEALRSIINGSTNSNATVDAIAGLR